MFNIIFTIAVVMVLIVVWIAILMLLKNSNTKTDDFDALIKEIREENNKKKK